MARKNRDESNWYRPPVLVCCPLCERPIPNHEESAHHLVPKCKGGRETEVMHRVCHRQIHALFSETELATTYNTAEALLAHPEMLKFVEWVKKKPNGFYQRAARSGRRP